MFTSLAAAIMMASTLTAPATAQPLPWCPQIPGHQVECGTITRPLVAGRPKLGTTPVGYALVRRSALDRPASGTILGVPGGPGLSSISLTGFFAGLTGSLLDRHDLLLVDPRGVGASGPLSCGAEPLSLLKSREWLIDVVGRCGKRLGARAAGYTSAATADDLDAVRKRLGVGRVDLVGGSYGSYLMQVYARRHPASVKSIVLSGVLPEDLDVLQRPSAKAVPGVLRAICRRSGSCDGDATVRDLRTFAAKLRRQPVVLDNKVTFTEDKLAGLLFQNASAGVGGRPGARTLLGRFPAILRDAARGDYARLTEAVGETERGPSSFTEALSMAIACNDFPAAWSKSAPMPRRVKQLKAALAAQGDGAVLSPEAAASARYAFGDFCLGWPRTRDGGQAADGALPDVPVLVLNGDLDANTPSSDARKVSARFRRAIFVSVPNTGHLPFVEPSGCVRGMIAAFVTSGGPGPLTCLSGIPPISVDR
ncbi:alpha/beta hydrolase [Spongiactinospora rosea]|uniref:Alpha/beta hydrolase n=1 Tax=Spongiactinospora rosea TaxID=2248750 RepID=A0A366M0V1_9ACTN|nr:alpha/beta fold hydrolase [Spongiactinospora rosea]RBQ19413.1 alpha/beta hydrolase [Spongiactinospora rosea]